jgi:hypothetical protein
MNVHSASLERTMIKLLIATDRPEPAEHAVLAAARFARGGAVEAVPVNVRGSPNCYGELPPIDYELFDARARRRQDALLKGALERTRATGLQNVRSGAAMGFTAGNRARCR